MRKLAAAAPRLRRIPVVSVLAGIAMAITMPAFAATGDPARAVVDALYGFRATHGPAYPDAFPALRSMLSPGLLARCVRYQRALDAPGAPTDLVPTINYDPLTGSQEALSSSYPAAEVARRKDWVRYRIRATYLDGAAWNDIDVQVVKLSSGQWRISNINRLRQDCALGPYPDVPGR
ncbi:hypothetical protein [Stenotrophomonas sp. PS02301]|uniref:hypothetical protein n=1 Tax=Stenotrophomonas sp. PS02301 TaxID=2991427 RepID=UPI00249A1A91|nr:hypothetical protein [Stenotrophomonas sp. PS02301]